MLTTLFLDSSLGARRLQSIDEVTADSPRFVLCKDDIGWYVSPAKALDGGRLIRESFASVVAWWDDLQSRAYVGPYDESLTDQFIQEIVEALEDEWQSRPLDQPVYTQFDPRSAPSLVSAFGPLGKIFADWFWDPHAAGESRLALRTLTWWIDVFRGLEGMSSGGAEVLYPLGIELARVARRDFEPHWFPSAPSKDLLGSSNSTTPHHWLEPDGLISVGEERGVRDFEVLNRQLNSKLWRLGGIASAPPFSESNGALRFHDNVLEFCEATSSQATAAFQDLLSSTMRLEIHQTPLREDGVPELQWFARDESGALVALPLLSPTQRRWAAVAISGGFSRQARMWPGEEVEDWSIDWVMRDEGEQAEKPFVVRWPVSSLTLIDEPEAGLHPLAVSQIGEALGGRARMMQEAVVVTTHSPQILKASTNQVFEVFRAPFGSVQARQLPSLSEVQPEELGMSVEDILLLYRVVLIVEGQHDEVVLRELIGARLDRQGVLMLPLHGARGAKSLADAALLARMLSAPIVVLFDNDQSGHLDRFWNDLRALSPDEPDRIDELVKALPPEKEFPERAYISSLARELHALRQVDRFLVQGLSLPDIIEYLPVEEFVSKAGSWDKLRTDHAGLSMATEKEKRRGGFQRDFKAWLAKQHDASFSDSSLRAACATLTATPEEFVDLAALLGDVAAGRLPNDYEGSA